MLPLIGCSPSLVDEPWLVSQRRVVAVIAEPPEVTQGSAVRLRAVIASPDGPLEDADVRWARCDEQTPFSQNESTNLSCLALLTSTPAGTASVQVTIPDRACAVFGPDVATATARPRDPDATGGYYQPIGLELDGQRSFAFERLRCDPANITNQTAQAFRQTYTPNTNPTFTLMAFLDGRRADWNALEAGRDVRLVADWSASPEESFPSIDRSTLELVTLIERYDVSWFVSVGHLDRARSSTGQASWTLPTGSGEGTVWAVLRDSRGGAAVVAQAVSWGP